MNAAALRKEDGGKHLHLQAYEQLLEMIFDGTLPAGTLLIEQSLAQRLKISRTPVREALVRLEVEGLVTRHAGRALVVRELQMRDFLEILRVRSVLETEAVGQACLRITPAKLSEVRRTIELLLESKDPDADEQVRADDALHDALVEACGNAVLAELVKGLRRRTRFLNLRSLPGRFVAGCQEHLAIIEALERRDENDARLAVGRHFDNVRQGVLRRLDAI